jgi:calnexin
VAGGSLTNASAFDPPLRPPREVPDPEDAKPDDWDEREE